MKKNYSHGILLILLIFCVIPFSNAQAPEWQWAVTTGEQVTANFAKDIATDASGNIYMTGYFNSATIEFGGVELTKQGTSANVYIAKYSPSGIALWAHNYGTTSYNESWGVAADAAGNAYITGNYRGASITFGAFTLTNFNTDVDGIFVVKYDAAGNVVWAKNGTGAALDKESNDIAVDAAGNVTIAGYSSYGTFSFDGAVLNNPHNANLYIVKFDTNGNVLWSTAQTVNSQNRADGVATDADGNTYISGYYNYSTIYGLPYTTNMNAFLIKFDPQGNMLWAVSPNTTSDTVYGFDVFAGSNGKVIIAGSFNSTTLTIGTTTLTNASTNGSPDIFVAQYDTAGNFEWAKSSGGNKWDRGYKVVSDVQGSVYLSGYFASQTVTFGAFSLTKSDDYTELSFITKYGATGDEAWALKVDKTTTGSTSANGGLACDANGNIYLAGTARDDVAFGNLIFEDGGIFLAKLASGTAGLNNVSSAKIVLHPNPVTDILNIDNGESITKINIYNTLGQIVFSADINPGTSSSINIAQLPAGYYVAELMGNGVKTTKKILKN